MFVLIGSSFCAYVHPEAAAEVHLFVLDEADVMVRRLQAGSSSGLEIYFKSSFSEGESTQVFQRRLLDLIRLEVFTARRAVRFPVCDIGMIHMMSFET